MTMTQPPSTGTADGPAPSTGSQDTVTKATLVVMEPKKNGARELDRIDFPFNPKDYSITRSAGWRSVQGKRGETVPEYMGAAPTEITVEMFLDEADKDDADISRTVAKVLKCLDTYEGTGDTPSAPHVLFQWGDAIRFKGIITEVAVTYTMFRGRGTPIRGTARLTIKEMPTTTARQNPTSGGPAGHRPTPCGRATRWPRWPTPSTATRRVWRILAEANDIDDPSRIPAGFRLLVPAS